MTQELFRRNALTLALEKRPASSSHMTSPSEPSLLGHQIMQTKKRKDQKVEISDSVTVQSTIQGRECCRADET